VRKDESFDFEGQTYECVGQSEYHDTPARRISVLELYSRCPDCNRGFLCLATRSQIQKRELPRRCDDCQSVYDPVSAKAQCPPTEPWLMTEALLVTMARLRAMVNADSEEVSLAAATLMLEICDVLNPTAEATPVG
jgi:hypothetical protein